MEERKLFSRNDLLLILLLALLAGMAMLYLHIKQKDGAIVQVELEGEIYDSYDLNRDQTISIEGEDFVSTLVIKDGQAEMTQADCPDQICVDHRPISHDGETIVCLPHKLVVEIIAGDASDGSEDTEGSEIDVISK